MATEKQAKFLGRCTKQQLFSKLIMLLLTQLFPKLNRCIFRKKAYLCVVILRAVTMSAELEYNEFKSQNVDNKFVFFIVERQRSYIQPFIWGQI